MRHALLSLLLTACIQESAVWVTLTGDGAGIVTSNPEGISCGGDDPTCAMLVAPGSAVELVATPTAAFDRFMGWSGDCTGEGTCMLDVVGDVHVDAQFAVVKYTLTIELAGTGSRAVASVPGGIACDDSGGDCTHEYAPGTQITLTARDETVDVAFESWIGIEGCTTDPVCTFTIDRDVTARASFAGAQQVIVSLYGTGMGRVVAPGIDCPGDCSEYYAIGSSVTFDTIPMPNSMFARWLDGDTSSPRTIPIPATVVQLGAEFRPLPTLAVTKQGNGMGTVTSVPAGINCGPTCAANWQPGTQVTLTATPAIGATFTGWTGACTGTGTCTITLQTSTSVTATFSQPMLSVTRQGAGTVTSVPAGIDCGATCSMSVAPNTQVTLTATPASGSTFTGWSGACSGTGTCTVTVQSNTNVIATFSQPLFGPPMGLMVGNKPTYVETADFNADGKLDLVVANDQSFNVQVLLGNGNGTFQMPLTWNLGANPFGLAVGDLDGNGRPDIVVALSSGNVVPILWTTTNTLELGTIFMVGATLEEIALGDLNGDGKLDAAVTEQTTNTVRILEGTGTGGFTASFTYTVGTLPTGVAIGDFNADGKPDVVTSSYSGGTVSVLINNGNAQFAAPVSYTTTQSIARSVSVGDLDGDGKQDLVVANFTAPTQSHISVLRGNGNGTFATAVGYGVGSGAWVATIADLDLDGKQDVVVPCSYTNDIWWLRGNGATLSPATKLTTGNEPHDVAVADFNGDTRPDLAIANGAWNSVVILIAQ